MFKNMKIGVRLGSGFAVLVLILLTVGGVGYRNINSIYDKGMDLVEVDGTIQERAARVRAGINSCRRYEKDILLNLEYPDKVVKYYKDWEDKRDAVIGR